MSARLVAVPSRSYVEGRDTWNEALFGLLSALLFPSSVIKIVLPNYYNLKLPVRWERFAHSFRGYLHKHNFLVYFDEMEPV